MRSRRLKVLVISGGGVFGMIPCHFLSIAGDSDPAKLDVIAGTSAGGILALCYASGRGTRETRKLFREAVPAIFKKSWLRRLLPGRSLYSSSGIESFLRQALPGKVRDCPRRFIVPSLNFRRKAPVIFHNFDGSYLDYELWKIGRSTSAAPIFFEPFSENILIDGGIIENVPVGIMYSVLQRHFHVPKRDIDVFVLGTGVKQPDDTLTLKKVKRFSLLRWARELLPVIATEANEMLSITIGENFGFHSFRYFNPVTVEGGRDDAGQVSDGSLEESCEIYNSIFLKEWNAFLEQ